MLDASASKAEDRKGLAQGHVGKEILLVEDDAECAQRIKQLLQPLGYQVDILSDGHKVLKRVREAAPDLLILDVVLPKMSGFLVARFLKFDAKYKKIPILMLTVLNRPSDREQGKSVGVDLFLTKPVGDAQLLEAIERLLKTEN